MKRTRVVQKVQFALALSGVLLLTSCEWVKSKFGGGKASGAGATASGEVLLQIQGKPALTVAEFESYYDMLLEQQPQIKQLAMLMPDLKQNVYSTLVGQKILEFWAQQEKISDKAEYQADRKMLLENVDRSLAIKYFQAEHPVMVSDTDVKKYYEQNKDTVYLMAPAGVQATGVSFDQEEKAKAFFASAQGADDLNKAAASAKVTAKNFGRVNEQSQGIEHELKTKILGMKKFPSTELFKVGKTFWVVQAKSKDAAKYYSFDQAKEDAKNRLTSERSGEMFNTEIAKLKERYAVVEYADYFKKKEEAAAESKAAEKKETAPSKAEAAPKAETPVMKAS